MKKLILFMIILCGCSSDKNDITKMSYIDLIQSFHSECSVIYWGKEEYKNINWLKLQLDHQIPPTENEECIESITFTAPYVVRIRTKSNAWILAFEGNPEIWVISNPIPLPKGMFK